jgi:alcohol dehydrogenase (cytochrome c)
MPDRRSGGQVKGMAMMPDEPTTASSPTPKRFISRRTLIAGAGAGATVMAFGGLGALTRSDPAVAQDATPSAHGVAEATHSPASPVASPAVDLPAVPPEAAQAGNDWPLAQGNYAATRLAGSSPIDSTTVGQLGVAWRLPLDATSAFGAITSNPIVVGDTVYIIDMVGNVQSLDRATGAVNWRNDYNVPTYGPNGVAIGYGYLVSVLGDTAEVVCVQAETGQEIWRFQLSNHGSLGITMAPLIYDGVVYVSTEPGGNTKGNYGGGASGVVYAMDLLTGTTLWTWNTSKGELFGNFVVNSGGGLWYPPSVDEATGVLYMGIGNAGPFPDASSRPGPNDYANNLVALDPNQGRVLWSINVKPHDIYDHDNQHTPVLGDVDIGGVVTPLVFSSGKHGFVLAAHRVSGIEYWKVPIGQHVNDMLTEIPMGTPIVTAPGDFGGVESPLAYKDGVVYAVALNLPYTMFGENPDSTLATATSSLVAIDAATGQFRWNIEVPTAVAGAGPTIANDLVFIGGLDGLVRAYGTDNGALVWTFQTPAGINAPFAIAGDTLLVPSSAFIFPSPDTADPLPRFAAELIALRLGAMEMATPVGAATDPAEQATPAPNAGGGGTVITMVDIAFNPAKLTIAANTDIVIDLPNTGTAVHNFNIDGKNNPSDPGIHSGDVQPGQGTTVTVNLPAGDWYFYCSIPGHEQAGMLGILTAQ